jgi:hypothetical protein
MWGTRTSWRSGAQDARTDADGSGTQIDSPNRLSDDTSNGPYDSTSKESLDNDSSSDGELLPGDIVAAKEIINLKKDLKEEKRLRSKEKTQHKTASALRIGALHLGLVRDKEIKSMKIDEKKVERDFKAKIMKNERDYKAKLGAIIIEIKKLKDEYIKPLRKELKEKNKNLTRQREKKKPHNRGCRSCS